MYSVTIIIGKFLARTSCVPVDGAAVTMAINFGGSMCQTGIYELKSRGTKTHKGEEYPFFESKRIGEFGGGKVMVRASPLY